MNISQQAKEQIAKNLDLSGMEPKQRDKVVSGLLENILQRVNMAVSEKLSDEDRKKILKLKNESDILNFMNGKIENLQDLVGEITGRTIEEFKKLS